MLTRAGIVMAVFSTTVSAQWLNYPNPRTPRTKDGKPNLSAAAPRIAGKPDLSGVWEAERTPPTEYARVLGDGFPKLQIDLGGIARQALNVFWDMKPEEVPLRPEAKAILQQRAIDPSGPPTTRCLPSGVPQEMFFFAFKMIQAPQEIIILSETGDPARQIYTDRRKLPDDPQPSWMGYSVGRWEGDVLVVDTIGITESSWLDGSGHPRSESMRITERYRRPDFGHMDLEMTIEDAKYYTRPFSVKAKFHLIPDSDVIEYVCLENERDQRHLPTR